MEIKYLEEVEFDLQDGRTFYDEQQLGIGDYFADSILADAESLLFYAGTHSNHFGFFRLLGKTFPFAIYYLINDDQISVCAILICGEIRRGSGQNLKTGDDHLAKGLGITAGQPTNKYCFPKLSTPTFGSVCGIKLLCPGMFCLYYVPRKNS